MGASATMHASPKRILRMAIPKTIDANIQTTANGVFAVFVSFPSEIEVTKV